MNPLTSDNAVKSNHAAPAICSSNLLACALAPSESDADADRDEAQAQVELGIALQQAGNLPSAIVAYARAITLQPDWAQAYALQGIALQMTGQFDAAIEAFQLAVKLNPEDAQTWSNLGVLLQERARSDEAVEALHNAIQRKPRFTEAHANLGVILRAQGKLEESVAAFQCALALKPNYAEAHANLGACFNAMGRMEEAASALRVATILKPDYAEAYADLGVVMHALGRPLEAASACRSAISLGIESSQIYLSMGVALQDAGQQEEAAAAYRRAIDIEPECADAYSNLGVVLLEQAQPEKAIAAFLKAAKLNPAHPHAFANLSIALHEQGDDAQAAHYYQQAILLNAQDADVYSNFAMVRIHQQRFDDALGLLAQAAALNQNHGRPLKERIEVPYYRIKHDHEQLSLLRQRKLLAPEFDAYAAYLDSLADGMKQQGESAKLLIIEGANVEKIAPSYNRLVHVPAPVALPAPYLNPDLDVAELERAYLESKPEVVCVDDFLAPATLDAIRNFCLEATVWKKQYPNGYLGATLKDGFAAPLILQISEELRLTFPAIFGKNLLEQAWAFKYDSTMKGINVHADFASVNVNFWITRNEACLSRDNGGLIIWDVAAPKDWSFQKYNGDEGQIRRFLSTTGAKSIRVPYRENRCVIFNSTLFHETDRFEFNDAYEDRRINVTLLYGKGLKMR